MKFRFLYLLSLFLFANSVNAQSVLHVNAKEFKRLLVSDNSILLDVRTPEETASGLLGNASAINFYDSDFERKLSLIQKDKTVFVYCRSGGRSLKAAEKLIELGQAKVYNLKGGLGAWQAEGFSVSQALATKDLAIKSLTIPAFNTIVSTNEMVLADFHTQWCVPCKKLVPIITELEIEFGDSISFLRIDIDESKDLSVEYDIVAVPTLVLFKNGEIVWRNTGLLSKEALKAVLFEYR